MVKKVENEKRVKKIKIGIFGGTGLYDPTILKKEKELKLHTPFGPTSDLVITGEYEGIDVVIIPRHDRHHRLNPSAINYRANVWSMKDLGVTHILAPSAVGSLKEGVKPGDIVLADQFIDRTTARKSTFYEGAQVCHISVADPFCNSLRSLLNERTKSLGIECHSKGTVVVIEGPRFSTRAESKLFREWGADIINMTIVPECVLARETEMCYQPIAMVTDYDSWKTHTVDAAMVTRTMKENMDKVRRLLTDAILRIADSVPDDCSCRHALDGSFI